MLTRRRKGLTLAEFVSEYEEASRPVILTDVVTQWQVILTHVVTPHLLCRCLLLAPAAVTATAAPLASPLFVRGYVCVCARVCACVRARVCVRVCVCDLHRTEAR